MKGSHAVVGDNDYLPEYKIIQENPVEPGSVGGSAAAGTGTNGGGKVRFKNPFGISTEDVNAVDKVCFVLLLSAFRFYLLVWLEIYHCRTRHSI